MPPTDNSGNGQQAIGNGQQATSPVRQHGEGSQPGHAKAATLAKRPHLFRGTVTRGLVAAGPPVRMPDAGTPELNSPVVRNGGEFGCGLIRGVSMCTRGEALGHGLWLDEEFIGQVAGAGSAAAKGVKCRFTHPGLSADGLGTFLGRLKDSRAQDGRAFGDLHISPSAQHTPDGDLAAYVMDLAETDPAAFGASIVFEHDVDAEEEFEDANKQLIPNPDGTSSYGFVSPDPENVQNLPHARLWHLRAADVVDDPAANPTGLFHREQEFAQEADALMSYALGLTGAAPAVTALSLHPDRVKGFVARFLDSHDLAITKVKKNTDVTDEKKMTQIKQETRLLHPCHPSASVSSASKEKTMADETQAPILLSAADQVQPAAETGQQATQMTQMKTDDTDADASSLSVTSVLPSVESVSDGSRFLEAFGDKGGLWFAQGKTFEQAQVLHLADVKAQLAAKDEEIAKLKAEKAALETRIGAVDRGDTAPVTFSPASAANESKRDARRDRLRQNLGDNLATFASGLRFVTPGNGQ
jgi:hypothetical protein